MMRTRMYAKIDAIRQAISQHRLTREKLVDYQNRQLRRVIGHAYQTVPLYRELFDRNALRPRDIRGVQDLTRIPITERKTLHESPRRFMSEAIRMRHPVKRRTSGSTGMPVSLERSWSEEFILKLAQRRATRQYGAKLSDRHSVVGLSSHTRQLGDPTTWLRMLRRLGLFRITLIDCLQDPETIVALLQASKPDTIGGYSGTLALAADIMLHGGGVPLRPRVVIAGAETMTPAMRRKISTAFQCPVFDVYGSHEFGLLAWQCRKTGVYHVYDDNMVLEVIRDGRPAKPGESGEVIGTALHSYAMPFIRYRLGDIVVRGAETCACGSPFSTIERIEGRKADYFVMPSGRRLHPYRISVNQIRDRFPWIRQFQLVQERKDLIIVRIVAPDSPSARQLQEVKASVQSVLEKGVEVRVKPVPSIEPGKGGKFVLYRSLVASEYDG